MTFEICADFYRVEEGYPAAIPGATAWNRVSEWPSIREARDALRSRRAVSTRKLRIVRVRLTVIAFDDPAEQWPVYSEPDPSA